MTFIYGAEGVIGFMINGISYLYRKNLFGDVTEIYNETRQLVGKYSYTAFGECTVEVDVGQIATKNPIRYRSYYYDEEINLYYLKTRYYDPEIGRFITIDDVSYLDSEAINGLNLYAYCANNPVMRTDSNGNAWKWINLIALALGAVFQAIFSAVTYVVTVVASLFDSDIRADMNNIGWNLFNDDANLAANSNKVSFYKGVPVIRTNESRSGTFGAIWLAPRRTGVEVQHEFGHVVQMLIMGVPLYLIAIGLPSAAHFGEHKWPEVTAYYRRPWEVSAELFGGVPPRDGRTSADESLAWWYFIVAMLFGPFAYFFAL